MTIRILCLTTLALALQATAAAAQAKPGDIMIEKYLAAETDKLSQKFLDGAKTIEEWQEERPRLHQEYLYMLGLWPLPEKTPLRATITGTIESEGVLIDKLHYQSKPGLYVTANLYRPKETKGKLPAVLYVCGHANRGRDGNKAAYQDHGMWFASNGYICLMVDTLQLGEIPGVHHGTYGRPWLHLKQYEPSRERKRPENVLENRFWWHSAGYTPAGVECWNGIRGIDYLISREDVDAKRIAVTGISGGGAATFWIAAADDRVACAVPVSGMADLESYVKDKVINGHCDCMFLYNTFQWDWTTIAAMVAPRPLLFANSDNDRIFPMDANRRVIAKLRKLYTMYGKPELVDDYVSEGGHAYRPDLRIAIFKWINKHVKGDTGPVEDSAKFKEIAGKELRVFPDAQYPADAINDRIDETFVPRAKVELPAEGRLEDWRNDLAEKLRKYAFAWPERIPQPRDSRLSRSESISTTTSVNEFGLQITLYAKLDNPPKAANRKDLEKAIAELWDRPHVLVVGVEAMHRVPDWAATHIGDGSAVVRLPWSRSWDGWTPKSPPNYVERSQVLLGRTVDSLKVWDIASAVRYEGAPFPAELMKKNKIWKVIGRGQAGILAAYAALFEPSIKEVVIIDPPKSHLEGPHFLNVLRVLDIPDALGMLAPRKLTLINARDPAFDRVEQIYRIAGAADKLSRK